MFDPKMVEAAGRVIEHAYVHGCNQGGGDVAIEVFTALCAHFRITPEALNALAKGEAVVVPREATEEMIRKAECAVGEELGFDPYMRAEWRAMLAASPYAPPAKGGGDE